MARIRKTETINLRLPAETKVKLQALAKEGKCSVACVVTEALTDYLKSNVATLEAAANPPQLSLLD